MFPKLERLILWGRRLFCCLVSQRERRIPYLRLTFQPLTSQLRRLLGLLRFPVLPVTQGEFPIQQTPLPEPAQEPPVPDADGDSDSGATVDYREDSLLALAGLLLVTRMC